MIWNDLLKLNIPKGWSCTKLGKLCRINDKTLSRKDGNKIIEYLDTSNLTENVISQTQLLTIETAPSRAQRVVKNNTILFSTVRPRLKHYGILMNPSSNLIVSTGFATIDTINIELSTYCYLTLTRSDVIEYLGGIADTAVSAYPSLNPSDLESLAIPLPDEGLIKKFFDITNKIFNEIENLSIHAKNLCRLRDELLPMLLNGQVNCDLVYIGITKFHQ